MLGREQHGEVQNGVTEEKRKPISYTDDTHFSILLSKRDKKKNWLFKNTAFKRVFPITTFKISMKKRSVLAGMWEF